MCSFMDEVDQSKQSATSTPLHNSIEINYIILLDDTMIDEIYYSWMSDFAKDG